MRTTEKHAFDTETDKAAGEEEPVTVSVQRCCLDAGSEDAVNIDLGRDCYDRFFGWMGEGNHKNMFAYNLDYEWSRMESYVRERFEYWEKPKGRAQQPLGTYTVFGDDHFIYSVTLRYKNGTMVKIKDDWQHFKKAMADAAADVYAEHPDWWPAYVKKEDLKMEVDKSKYNNGWSDASHPDHEEMLAYARRDAFSQAMISRYLEEKGAHRFLTSSSAGMSSALGMRYRKDDWDESVPEFIKSRYSKKAFQNMFPPLPRERQDYVEKHILGGFVYGKPGVHKGCFVHLDYKSSYPYYYYAGEMFKGLIQYRKGDDPYVEKLMADRHIFKWVKVSFSFNGLREHGLPLIQGNECDFPEGRPTGCYHDKMLSGKVTEALYTLDYWEELQKHYFVEDVALHEVWYARKAKGEFRDFIAEEYFLKEVYKALGLKAEADVHKRNMNTAVHGKTITKTHRKTLTYENGEKGYKKVVNDPEYCAMIGFTAMMQRRVELVRDCRTAQEAGYECVVNDTDSAVFRATEEQIRELFGDRISVDEVCDGMTVKQKVKELVGRGLSVEAVVAYMRAFKDKIVGELGKFEIERDADGNAEFDEFRCWGLKRYLEVNHGAYRKSAFAGMGKSARWDGEEAQGQKMLLEAPVDGSTFVWEQERMVTRRRGKMMISCHLSAKKEDIYYRRPEDMEMVDKRGLSWV